MVASPPMPVSRAAMEAAGLLLGIAENLETSLSFMHPFSAFPLKVSYFCCYVCSKPILETPF